MDILRIHWNFIIYLKLSSIKTSRLYTFPYIFDKLLAMHVYFSFKKLIAWKKADKFNYAQDTVTNNIYSNRSQSAFIKEDVGSISYV